MDTRIQVQTEDFDMASQCDWLKQGGASCGAIVTFAGLVREHLETSLNALYLEHYPGMTEKSLAKIVSQARERWSLGRVVVIHRVGELALNDNIVFVGVASPHRKGGFEAAQFIMDYLKRDAPFWKKERSDLGDSWVAQKQTDLAAAKGWDKD